MENAMLKIYGVPISVHTRKVLVAARAKKIPFENVPVIPFAPPADWDTLSPTGKIPVAVDGDFTLPDSSVICAYLERLHPAPALYPAEPRAQARALWLEEYADGTLFREVVHGLFFQKVIRPNILKQPSDAAAVAALEDQAMPKAFDYLESAAASGELAAERLGIGEIAVVSNLVNLRYLGYAIDARRHPKLAALFRRQTALPAMAATLAAEQPVAAQMGLDRSFMSAAAAA
jgi:glutathione S-transferase